MAGVSGELVPTPGSSTQWSPKVEGGFSRLEKLTAGDGQIMWKATTKQGRKYYFGQTTASRQYQVTPLVAGNIFGWLLDRVEDTDGNYMTYSYWTDSSNNQVYLDHIDYAGNGATAPTNTIKFWLDDGSRPDQAELYATHYRVKTTKRLATVEVKAGGNLVRAYKLTYVTSGTTSSSVVATIQQFGKDATVNQSTGAITPGAGPQQPAVVMGLPAPNNSLTAQSPWGTYVGINSNATLWHTDMNGDGRPDLLYLNTAGTEWHVMLNTGTGLSTAVKWGDYVGMYSTNTIWPVDMNGDGKSDLLYLNTAANEWHVMLNTGTALSSAVKWGNYVGINSNATLWPADMNGDGKSDLLYLNTAGTEWHVMLNTGSALSAAVKWGDYVGINSTLTIWPTDMNGDGKPELLYLNVPGTEWHVMLNTGSALSAATKWGDYVGINSTLSIWAIDMNGDGRRDLLYLNTAGTEWHVMLNTGTALRAAVKWGDYVGINSGLTIWPTDMNGDGKPELLYLNTAGTEWHVMLNTGSALSAAVKWGDYVGINSTATIWPADMNGDGRMDLLYLSTPGTQWMVMKNLSTGDLLSSVSTGLGGATTITYDTSANDVGNRMPFAMQRVKSISACDNWNSGTSTCTTTPSITTYSYTGGSYHLGARDVRGVNYTKVTSQAAANGDQTISETWFHQGSRIDAVGETETELLADATAFTKGLPYKSRVTDQTGKAYSESTTTYLADGDGVAPFFTPQAITTTKHFNSAGVEVKQTQTEAVSYDSYGNLTLAYNRGDFTGNNAITSDDTTTILSYNTPDTTNWLIGFPTVTTTRAGLGTGGAILSQTTTSYDGTGVGACTAVPSGSATVTKGHVTKVDRLLNPGGTQVTSGMEYDPQTGVLLCSRDALGNKTTLTYDPTNTFPLTSTNALGHVTTTVYYGVNGVASDTGLYGQAKSVTDPNGKTTTNTYDALGRKLTTTTPDGLVQSMAYNYGGAYTVSTQHVQSTTSGGGLSANLVSKTYFDGLGRTTKTEQPGAADGGANLKVLVTETQYDIRGLVTQTSLPYIQGSESATGRWRTMTYDALGRLTKTTNPDNTSSIVCYNAWTTTSLDPKLHKKVQTKDALGRLVTVQEYTGTGSATDCSGGTLYATTSYSYDRLGNLLGVTDAKGNVSSMTYDTLGRKLTMHDPDMGDWSYTYDANGNLLTQVDAKNQKLCLSYDALNRRTQKNYGTTTVACGTNTIVYAYDDTVAANNGKGRLKQVSDPAQSVTFQYDSRGRISQTAKTLDGSTYITTSAYDGLGRLTTVSYPTSPIKTVTYTYDGPQLKSVQEGATTYVTYGGWNALGKPATSIFGNGVVTTHTYANTANATCTQQTFRLCTLKTTGPSIGGGASGTLTFIPEADTSLRSDEPDTALGNLDHVVIDTSPMREAYLRFNITGLPSGATITSASLTLVNGGYATPESNDGGAIFKFAPTDPAWAESVPTWNTRAGLTGIDASGLLSKVGAVNPGASYTFTNLQSAISGNGRVTFVIRPQSADGAGYFTKEATVAGQRPVLTVHYTTSSSPGASYQDLRYVFEANGNVGDIYDATVAANAGDQHFSYDDLDRLTLANGPYGASGINATLAYSYDQIGNMIVNPQVGAYSYPASGLSSVRPHAVSVAGPYPISYDNNGNVVTMTDPTGFFGYSASYNTENRLSSLTTTYGGVPTTATFVYDGDGGRVKKTEGTTTTRYISKLYECDNSNCSRFIWAGSTRIATIAVNTGATQYWHGDHLGSSSVITDSTGAKVQTLAYYPYGDLRTNQSFTTPAINVPYKYTGKELDASSNLHFYEARYYHAVFGRFVSPDTIVPNLREPQNLNRYSYVRNNPLRYTDPTGHCTEDDGNQSFCNNGQPVNQAQDTFVLPDIKVTAQREAFTSGHTSLGNGNTYSLSYLYSWGSAFSPSTFGVFPVGNASPNITVPPQVTINNAIDVIAQTNFGKTVRPKLVQRLRDLNKAHRIVPSYQVNPNEKGFYSNGTIFIDPSLLTTNLVELPGVLAHEAVHAGQKEGLTHQERVDNEIEAFNTEYTLETELHDGAFKDFYRTLVPRDMTREQIEKLYP